MKERPILFSTEMVKAILEGRKTQTRRIVKLPEAMFPIGANAFCYLSVDTMWVFDNGNGLFMDKIKCPFGKPGDRLWVRETWAPNPWRYLGGCKYIFRADYEGIPKCEIGTSYPSIDKWKPSIFMPREASRILLEVTDVRVERLRDISEEDAIAEGIAMPNYAEEAIRDVHFPEPTEIYMMLWESINGKGSWDKNPWVWVISFKKIEP